jgi:alpha-amylase
MMFLVVSSDACAKTLYLNTGGSSLWEKDNANKFAIWHWQGSGQGQWSGWMTQVEGNVWKADISDASDHVIYCRCNMSLDAPDWGDNKVWNKTGDLEIPSGQDLYTMTDWVEGVWSVYGEGGGGQGGGGKDPVTPSDYATAVPDQCEDVMLQAFYWESNVNSGYGDTKWQTLTGQASEIGTYFDLVWLPPSAWASGISRGGLGYIPYQYSNQGCLMGKRNYLESLIAALHNNGVRVLADIVINHIGNSQNNCDGLYEHDFGSFNKFTPTKDWLTRNDEGGCSSSGHQDDGQHDANYSAARDWDHQNTNVQNMCKAYLKWMKAEMQYDGFRYDMVGGYHVSHINDYNSASKPYFSVIEYWVGDANELKTRIDEASKNTLAFDFAAKYSVFRDGIFNKSYSNCKNGGLRGKGYSKYAVTFIDNHDTFNRGSEGEDVANKRDGSSINDKSLMMRCNAYLLSMPGVPCVFWPHWVKYKAEIKKMIEARKKAGIHSESTVTEESGSDYYRATIQGKYGSVKLMLGSAASDAAPSGYTEAIKGSDYAMYYTGNGTWAVEHVNANSNGEKFLKDGQLYIRCGEKIYDAQGRIVK